MVKFYPLPPPPMHMELVWEVKGFVVPALVGI